MFGDFTAKERMTAKDVLSLRRTAFADARISDKEIRALLHLARSVPSGDPEWPQFLAEVVTDFAAGQGEPVGYVSDAAASILEEAMGPAEEAGDLQLDILAHLFHYARTVPDELSAYALLCVRAAILADGAVSAREVQALRQFLHAPGGDGSVGITRVEADLLFDIKDAVKGARNDPAWCCLFHQAVAAFVLSHAAYQVPSREEALRLQAFIERPGGIEWSAARPRRGMLVALWRGLSGQDAVESFRAERAAQRSADSAAGRVLTGEEIDWLISRIGRDGAIDAAERALISRLAELVEEGGGTLPLRLSQLAG